MRTVFFQFACTARQVHLCVVEAELRVVLFAAEFFEPDVERAILVQRVLQAKFAEARRQLLIRPRAAGLYLDAAQTALELFRDVAQPREVVVDFL